MFSNLEGEQIASCKVDATGDSQTWTDVECNISETKGVHDLYLRFEGPKDTPLLNLDYFKFD
jgi:hypothetical protein